MKHWIMITFYRVLDDHSKMYATRLVEAGSVEEAIERLKTCDGYWSETNVITECKEYWELKLIPKL